MSSHRKDHLASLRQNPDFDVVVVGGGINGIGTWRDLALQGLRLLLVERRDFCSGCSAAPSRMIHGGLRYLENGESALVRESLRERDNLLRNAPHLVHPLPTTVPAASRFSGLFNAAAVLLGAKGKPKPRGIVPIRIGLMLYDLITRKNRLLPRHQAHGQAATLRHWPRLAPALRWTATYHDAWISHPERLGVEMILDTCAAHPTAVALNYADLAPEGDGFRLSCSDTGEVFTVRARLVVNATGAWLDQTTARLGGAAGLPMVSGTKGSHLILDTPALLAALDGHMLLFENHDGRVCVVFPYLGRVLAGSTDIRVDHPGQTRCSPEERDYILDALSRVFPSLSITPDQIVYSYAGIRPLPVSDHDFTGRISRGHYTRRIDGPVPHIAMVGGKWTTFRAFAAQVTDEALAVLGQTRQRDTSGLAIGGGRDHPGTAPLTEALIRGFGLCPVRAARLASIYGTRAQDFLTRFPPAQDRPLTQTSAISRGEVQWILQQERVVHLTDLLLRRTDLAITGVIDTAIISAAAALMAEAKGWTAARLAAETTRLRDALADWHGVTEHMLSNRALKGISPCG